MSKKYILHVSMKWLLILGLGMCTADYTWGQRLVFLGDTAQVRAITRYESVASEYKHFGVRHPIEYGIFVVQEAQTSEGIRKWRFSSWKDDTWKDLPALPTHYTLVGRRMILFYDARLSAQGFFEFISAPKPKRVRRSWERIIGDRVYKCPRWAKRLTASKGLDGQWKIAEDYDHQSRRNNPIDAFNGYVFTFDGKEYRFEVN